MSITKNIAKNTSFLLIAYFLAGLLTFVVNILAARYLGDLKFGIYSYAIALTSITVILSNIGLHLVITRDIARDKSKVGKYVGTVGVIEIFLSLLFLFIIFVIQQEYFSPDTVIVTYIVALAVLFEQTFCVLLYSIYRAYGEMQYEALSIIIGKIIFFVIGFLVLSLGYGLIEFVLVYLLSALTSFIVAVIFSIKFTKPSMDLDRTFVKYLMWTAMPFGIAGLLNLIFARVDVVILSFLKGNIIVGWYAAAYTLVGTLYFGLTALSIVMFPFLSKFFISSKHFLEKYSTKSIKYSVILLIPLGFGTMVLSDKIILIVYGDTYLPSIAILKILIWSGIFYFINGIYYTILGAINKQKVTTFIMACGAVANIVLNILLIPKFGYIGAAFVAVITQILCLFINFYFISHYLENIKIKKTFIKVTAASMIMSIFISYFEDLNLFLVIMISIIIYSILILLFKAFNKEDIGIIKKLISRN